MHFVERRAGGCKRKRGYRMHCSREGLRRRQFSLMVSSWSLAAPVSGGRSLLNRTCRYPNAETLGSITPTTTPPRPPAPAPSPALPAQPRSGHRIRLQAHRHSMDNTVGPNCPRCGQTPQTLEHWLDCSGTLQARSEIFAATEALPLSTLSAVPGNSVTPARRTL